MADAYTAVRFHQLLAEAKNPRTLYLSTSDFVHFCGMVGNASINSDDDGQYVMFLTTKVRPKIHVLDLSESRLFDVE